LALVDGLDQAGLQPVLDALRLLLEGRSGTTCGDRLAGRAGTCLGDERSLRGRVRVRTLLFLDAVEKAHSAQPLRSLSTHGREPVTERSKRGWAKARAFISPFLTAGEQTLAGFLLGSLRLGRRRRGGEELGDQSPDALADLGLRGGGHKRIPPVDRVDDQVGIVGEL